MDSLDVSDVRRLMDATKRIYAASKHETLSQEIFQVISALIPDVVLSLDQLNLKTGQINHEASSPLWAAPDMRSRVMELMPSHPVMPAALAGLKGAIRVTDCITQREFRETPHYIDTMRPFGIKHQIVVTLDIPGHMAGVTVNRGSDFTDRETAFLTLLAPHLAAASVKRTRIDHLEKSLASIPFPTPDQLQQVGFTARESEILFWVMQGKRDPEIAAILSERRAVSVRTINNHLRNILSKMGSETRTGACINALERIKQNLSIMA